MPTSPCGTHGHRRKWLFIIVQRRFLVHLQQDLKNTEGSHFPQYLNPEKGISGTKIGARLVTMRVRII
jgi:hypothetical protein